MKTKSQVSVWKWLQWSIEAGIWFIGLGLFRLLPITAASALGGWFLRKIGPLTRAHKTALVNIKLVFPQLSETDTKIMAMQCWDNLGRIGGELPHLAKLHPYAKNGRVEILGHEHLQAIIDSNKPAVLISGHFANWEVMAAAICMGGLPARVSYRHINNPWIDASLARLRLAYGIPELSAKGGTGAKEMLTAMQSGQSVTFLNDQKFNQGIAAPFFGYSLPTAPGPSRLALRFQAPILPVSIVRLPKAKFQVRFHPAITASTNPDKTQAIFETVEQINQFLETQILQHPESWFWVHRRWPKDVYR
ncbi:Lipid A biosynthesis lauroyl acyltransferase [hydrothermal vent metagenome]|uniref:Lipid A biosynthesis lauroyl acyltransferase n=1 Tax=hydrothermal vent metagenome TaxID=652676 RepID=A0A3B0RNB0_9ZZZZ